LAVQSEENTKSLYPRRVFAVTSFELSNGVLEFYDLKGLLKKKSILVRKIPVKEIDFVETYWNEISITWNGISNIFIKKDSFESFSDLRNKIRALLEENQANLQKRQNANLKQTELIAFINGVTPVVDICFDVLMLLHSKRADWSKITQISVNMLQDLTLTGETLPPLSLDFSSFSYAIASKKPEVVSTEAYSLLWAIHDYFFGLKPDNNKADEHPNFRIEIALIDSYYTLNDIFLGKIVEDKDTEKENRFLEESLKGLAEATGFRVDAEELKVGFARFDVEDNKDSLVVNMRAIFKAQFSQLAAKHSA
jgi:hypothetical protein